MNDQTPPAIVPGEEMAALLEADQALANGSTAAGDLEGRWRGEQVTGPQLVHSGTYALWLTPGGYYHLTYRRTAGTHPDTGQITAIENAPDVHLRDLPPHAADMVIAVLDRDTELPPMLQQFFFSGSNPLAGGKMAIMKQMAGLMKEGGIDQLLALTGADQNGSAGGGETDAGPVE